VIRKESVHKVSFTTMFCLCVYNDVVILIKAVSLKTKYVASMLLKPKNTEKRK